MGRRNTRLSRALGKAETILRTKSQKVHTYLQSDFQPTAEAEIGRGTLPNSGEDIRKKLAFVYNKNTHVVMLLNDIGLNIPGLNPKLRRCTLAAIERVGSLKAGGDMLSCIAVPLEVKNYLEYDEFDGMEYVSIDRGKYLGNLLEVAIQLKPIDKLVWEDMKLTVNKLRILYGRERTVISSGLEMTYITFHPSPSDAELLLESWSNRESQDGTIKVQLRSMLHGESVMFIRA